jgi:hypothetical protein
MAYLQVASGLPDKTNSKFKNSQCNCHNHTVATDHMTDLFLIKRGIGGKQLELTVTVFSII